LKGESFARRLIAWQRRSGRHDLPWQNTRDPYLIWLSEIMLQQTQVSTVIPYYSRFVSRFPNIAALAAAHEDDVLAHWSGLGYYARARNLKRATARIVTDFNGVFPADFDAIRRLPGVGRSTAGAISVFAFGAKRAILDGNVKRVLCRAFGVTGFPGEKKIEHELWRKAESLLPGQDVETYTQALMDVGAMVCTRTLPKCRACPLNVECIAYNSSRTLELPSPRSRSKLREKQAQWLIVFSRGQVLLEKRPPTGVWGSLWCFPELPQDADAEIWCAQHYGKASACRENIAPFQHAFTHFKLTITPRVLRLNKVNMRARQPRGVWLDVVDAIGAAVPAPVRQVLKTLANEHWSSN
jgi:A/G-specific adenine glycosylase